ncbi:SMI1/KNR4 family protein [Microbulbifer guangxiensis]|uniref:SMI1/KNR4 family protein n=1 Tax=Microbulbifer guangxiensis TaxID=2904249 RepID=UPI001F44CAF3|nr:SMI1/KNR4 family protein [Microbulbifer guangxiensis]
MPFELPEDQLEITENELGARLPAAYRSSMLKSNGGHAYLGEDDWDFYPIKDVSDKKRISRTCNHILSETESCREFGYFPEGAIAIAGNGCGDQLILLREAGVILDKVSVWSHEDGSVSEVAPDFSAIEKQ